MAKIQDKIYYDPETGYLHWKISGHGIQKDARAGSPCSNGYRQIVIDGKHYLEHRVAFFLMKGYWPVEIDHDNRNRSDNRWFNLIECDRSYNQKNKAPFLCGVGTNKSGVKGVYEKRPGYYLFKGRDGKEILHTRDFDLLRIYSAEYWAQQKELLQSHAF